MSLSCEHHAEDLVPYIRGDAAALVKTRLESHLQHCAACRRLHREMAMALAGAANLKPELKATELDRKVLRLSPYIEASRARQSQRHRPLAWLAVGTTTVAVLLAIALIAVYTPSREAVVAPMPVAALAEMGVDDDPFELDVAPVHHQPTPHIRILAATLWDGQIETHGRRTMVRMTRGFAAISFVGGQRRRLIVQTPAASLEVVGTRFLVDVNDDGNVTVAVADGRVRVRNPQTPDKPVMLRAGTTLVATREGTWTKAQELPMSAAHLDDPYLTELHNASSSGERVRTPKNPTLQSDPVMGPQVSDVLEQLERAEQLATRDQPAAAVTIYESCADDEDPTYNPYRDLCRLQLARLLAFELGNQQRARALFELLVGAPSDVGSEASLALCELDLESDPCQARACLTKLADLSSEPQLAREAKSLLGRWRLDSEVCK